jgi:hypothetical protein
MVSLEFFIDIILSVSLWPWGDSACNTNEYQEYFLGDKGGRCLGLTSLPPLCADYLKIWEPQTPGNLRACPGLYRDCFIFIQFLKKFDYGSANFPKTLKPHPNYRPQKADMNQVPY